MLGAVDAGRVHRKLALCGGIVYSDPAVLDGVRHEADSVRGWKYPSAWQVQNQDP